MNGSWPGFALLVALCSLGAAAASVRDRRFVGLVLVFAYVFPLLIRLLHGPYHIFHSLLWSGALLGALLPHALRTPWHVPERWRAALSTWALTIIAGAFVTMARESDFYAGLWFHEHVSAPLFAANWILHVAFVFVIGILWFDWLCGNRDLDLVAWIGMPLAASCAVLCGVAIYQGVFDIGFYNESIYGVVGRATGTVFDGNVCATIAAFWVGGIVLLGERAGRLRWPATLAGMAIAWMAVWATASRTGFGASLLITMFVAASAWRARQRERQLGWKSAATAVAAIAAVLAAFTVLRSSETGPVQRLASMLPSLSPESFVALAKELWNRNRYGEIATTLIGEHPWFGIGIGSFNTMGAELAMSRLKLALVPDNAQNWYRHQLVEFGVVGSLAWMFWVLSFAWFVFRRARGEPPDRTVVRGVLIAFALISLMGMPGQDVSVAITFWTFAGLYVVLGPPVARSMQFPRTWWPTALLVAVFTFGTWSVGVAKLRPPFRAQDNGMPYSYGFNPPEPDGRGGLQQWARQRAVTVVEAPKPSLRLAISVNHQDLAERPVHAKVWVNGALAIDTYLSTTQTVSKDISLDPARTHVAIETWVDRVVMPRDVGVNDGRELGLLVAWSAGTSP